jgi:PPK2 family polyphosphate:nucleotide phosphotransferase
MAQSIRDLLRVPQGPVNLAGYETNSPIGAPRKKNGDSKPLKVDSKHLAELQERLFAESTAGGKRSVLLVLQGMDTSGKGGTTEHVVGTFGPIGVQYTAFKAPNDEERQHDFLWRINKRVPPPGYVGVFDRSHYEDVLIVRVHNLVPREDWASRYDRINEWEAELAVRNVTVVKCFLHISFATQRERLLARLTDPKKHWKFNVGDIAERALWSEYLTAYEAILTRCNTDVAPWYVVPADDKPYRNWAVSQLLHEALEDLNPQYPTPELDFETLRARLAPPN